MKIVFSFFYLFFLLLSNIFVFFESVEAFSIDGVNSDIVSHAFVQTGAELQYFSDVTHQEIILAGGSNDLVDAKISNEPLIEFEPSELEFDYGVVGIPASKSVTLKNPTKNKLRFSAISSTSIEFHCSFLLAKVLDAAETTSFDVVYLPRYEGPIESLLYIHSSMGIFPYKVRGRSRTSPYRVRPITSVQVPMNATFSSPVQVHNPHSSVLQVKEIYVSGADVHLEMPNDRVFSKSERKALWEIAPFETKTVANAKILARHEHNTTAYIGLKVALKETKWPVAREFFEQDTRPPDILVIPLDVQIAKKRGIFSADNVLDFGLVKTGDKSKQLMFRIFSTVEKSLDIESIYVEKSNDYAHGIYMEFASKPPISVKNGVKGHSGPITDLAKVSIDSNYVLKNVQEKQTLGPGPHMIYCEGRIIAESRGGNYNVSVPYKATIYSGELLHNPEATAFHHKLQTPIQREIRLTNNFPFGLSIKNASIFENEKDAFQVELVTPQVVVGKGESMPALVLKYKKAQEVGYTTRVSITTNVSSFDVPILIFDGKLRVTLYSLEQDKFNFGDVRPGESRSILFAVTNENPVPIAMNKLRNPMSSITKLEYLGLEPGNHTILSGMGPKIPFYWAPGDDFALPGRSFAVFNLTLMTPKKGEFVKNEMFVIQTDYDTFTFPIRFKLKDATIYTVYSTYEENLHAIRLSSLTGDHRLFFQLHSNTTPIIQKGKASEIGKALFMPEASCPVDCYVGVPLHTSDGQWFSYGLKLPQNLAEIDSYLFRRLRRKWENLVAANRNKINTSIVVDTSHVKNFEVQASAELVWPRLLSHSVVHFPLTAVGNFTIVNLTLTNPTTKSIIVQLLPLVIYPDADAMLEFFRDDFPAPLTEPIEMNETLMFSLRDTELFTLKAGSPVPKLREQLESVIGSSVPRFTLSMMLQPGMKVRIRVGFLPTDYSLRSSLLLIRNNLTIIEPVVLYGRGAKVDVQIDNKTARAEPLLFEIQTSHLTDCNRRHRLTTTLTVKRSFMVKNTGEVSFTVVNMSINNHPCENRGFRILNCMPFRLEPNETYFLDVAYTPDFLMAVNEAALQLYMHMNGTPWVFFMGATLPRHMLALCHTALPRPPFEIIMRYLCITALLFCLICVVACSYLEGDRMITCGIRQQYTQERTVFDLKAIVDSVNQGGSGPKPEKPPDIRQTNIDPRKRRTHYVAIEPDANLFTSIFWQSVNWVLWLVSPVWVAVRSDPAPSQNKNKKKKQKRTVTNAQVVEQTTPQTFMHVEPLVNKVPIINNNNNNNNEPQMNHIEVLNHKSLLNHVSSENKENLDLNHQNYVPVNVFNKVFENHVMPMKQEAETELRLRKTIKTMDGNLDRVVNKKSNNTKPEVVNNQLDASNRIQTTKKKRERQTSKTENEKPEKAPSQKSRKESSASSSKSKEAIDRMKKEDVKPYSRESSNVSGTDYEESLCERSLPLPTDEETVDPGSLSDSNEMPEWADESSMLIGDDVEELYDELVATSMDLFADSRDSSPVAESSLSQSSKEKPIISSVSPSRISSSTIKSPKNAKKDTSDGTDHSKTKIETTKKKKKKQRSPKKEHAEIVAKLMKQYHDYLVEALANGKKTEELLPPKLQTNLPSNKSILEETLTLPADLSSNGFDPKFDWDDMKMSDLEDQGTWPIPSTSYDSDNLAMAEPSTSHNHSPTAYSHFGSIFPTTDPIWKPIFEDSENIILWPVLRTKPKNE